MQRFFYLKHEYRWTTFQRGGGGLCKVNHQFVFFASFFEETFPISMPVFLSVTSHNRALLFVSEGNKKQTKINRQHENQLIFDLAAKSKNRPKPHPPPLQRDLVYQLNCTDKKPLFVFVFVIVLSCWGIIINISNQLFLLYFNYQGLLVQKMMTVIATIN